MRRDQTFSKERRLRGEALFKDLFKNGKRCKSDSFLIRFASANSGYPRLGVSIGRRYFPKSSQRNRVKRLVKESLRKNSHSLRSFDIVVVPIDISLISKRYCQVETELMLLFKKARLLK